MPERQDDAGSSDSRRDLIKKGIVAGGLVWTAPAVQTMLATPAAAVSACGLNPTPYTLPQNLFGNAAPTTQFKATPVAGSNFTVWTIAWPVVAACPAGCSPATISFTWQNITTGTGGSGTLRNNANSLDMPAFGNTFTNPTTRIQLVNNANVPTCTGPHGFALRVTATITCGGSTFTVCRKERLRWTNACAGLQSNNTLTTICP